MSTRIRLGISTCPNDTFAFHGILSESVDLRGLDFDIELLDVQELNEGLLSGSFDVAKASFHAALLLADRYCVMPAGSALGFGVGPLLLSRHSARGPDRWPAGEPSPVVLCPGELTTASLLYRIFFGNAGQVQQVVFSEIMPALQSGTADYGVCIHEGRFTWQASGLYLAADLGALWESQTGQPLPLGGILGARSLGNSLLARISNVIRDSIEYGLSHRSETVATMKRYAQELSAEVLFQHVELYVNEQTRDLGSDGAEALKALAAAAHKCGATGKEFAGLEIFDGRSNGNRLPDEGAH